MSVREKWAEPMREGMKKTLQPVSCKVYVATVAVFDTITQDTDVLFALWLGVSLGLTSGIKKLE